MATTSKGFELVPLDQPDADFDVKKFLNDNWELANTLVAALETQVTSTQKMTDATTGSKYKFGINNGQVYIEEVE